MIVDYLHLKNLLPIGSTGSVAIIKHRKYILTVDMLENINFNNIKFPP